MFSALISTPSLCLTWHAYLPFRVFPLVWTSFWPPAVPALRCVDWRWRGGDGGRVATTLDSASRGCEFESQCNNTSCTVLWMVRSLVAWSIFSIVITEKSYPFIPSIISARLKYRGGGRGALMITWLNEVLDATSCHWVLWSQRKFTRSHERFWHILGSWKNPIVSRWVICLFL